MFGACCLGHSFWVGVMNLGLAEGVVLLQGEVELSVDHPRSGVQHLW